MNAITHQGIRDAILGRIQAGEWDLGDLIPGEAEFAEEYGCSRTTVNRALRTLAEEGIVERKRKGGTRICPLPARQARFTIPVIREQVEARGRRYRHRTLTRKPGVPDAAVRRRMALAKTARTIYVETLHLADDAPFAFERRWVDTGAIPEFETADLDALSANEWLVRTVPFTRGEVSLSATAADRAVARAMRVAPGEAMLAMERTTWLADAALTNVTFHFAPGYRLDFDI